MKETKQRVITFALAICLICSTLLALASSGLRERQERNRQLNIKKNILKVVGLYKRENGLSDEGVEGLYARSIRGEVIDRNGREVEGASPNNTKEWKERGLLPLYIEMKENQPKAYILYLEGKGLWSTIKGYLALGEDAVSVIGITFFEHGETPGLGGEIERDWFTDQWEGKKIFDTTGRLVPVRVIKGKVAQSKYRDKPQHVVDGISGATLTGRGINRFLAEDLKTYEPFLRRIRKGAAVS